MNREPITPACSTPRWVHNEEGKSEHIYDFLKAEWFLRAKSLGGRLLLW